MQLHFYQTSHRGGNIKFEPAVQPPLPPFDVNGDLEEPGARREIDRLIAAFGERYCCERPERIFFDAKRAVGVFRVWYDELPPDKNCIEYVRVEDALHSSKPEIEFYRCSSDPICNGTVIVFISR